MVLATKVVFLSFYHDDVERMLKLVQLRDPFSENGFLVSWLGQSKTLEGTLGLPIVSWGSWSRAKQVDAMEKSLTYG